MATSTVKNYALNTRTEGSLSSESVTFNNFVTRLYKVGSIVMISFSYTADENISPWASIATIPAGYRPPSNVFSPDVIRNGFYQITPDGDILTNSAIEANIQGTMAVATWLI